MRVAIAGAGIAGLTSAIALAERGFEADVYERAPALLEIGAGIQLAPNAMAVLDRLEVAGHLQGRLFEPDALVVRNAATGSVLTEIELGAAMRPRYGAPYCTLHRADLQAGLLAAIRRHEAIKLHLSADVRDVADAADRVALSAGGANHQASVLLGADGVRSTIRTGYFGHPGPASFGRSAWRAVIPAGEVDRLGRRNVGLWLGNGAHLVHYPVRAGADLNIVAIGAGTSEAPPAAPFKFLRDVLESVPDWKRTSLIGVDASQAWSRGRVALIGDAAHAMAPSAAQGGAQAIEDAWVLAARLAEQPSNPVAALAAYEHTRRARVERVARLSARNLQLYEMKGVPAFLRNSLLGISPASLLVARLDWLFRSSL